MRAMFLILIMLSTSALAQLTSKTTCVYNSTPSTLVSGQPSLLQCDGLGNLRISNANGDVTASGTITSTQAVSVATIGMGTVGIAISGTWSGILTVQVSPDGITYSSTSVFYLIGGFNITNIGVNGVYQVNTSGMNFLKVMGNSVTSGTATVDLRAAISVGNFAAVTVSQSNQNNLNATVYQPSGTFLHMEVDNQVDVTQGSTPWVDSINGRSPVGAPYLNNYGSSSLGTGSYSTIISSTSSAINEVDIFDNSGGIWYLTWASSCGSLNSNLNTWVIPPGGGAKDFAIPSGSCVGAKAIGTSITAGNVYITFSQ